MRLPTPLVISVINACARTRHSEPTRSSMYIWAVMKNNVKDKPCRLVATSNHVLLLSAHSAKRSTPNPSPVAKIHFNRQRRNSPAKANMATNSVVCPSVIQAETCLNPSCCRWSGVNG